MCLANSRQRRGREFAIAGESVSVFEMGGVGLEKMRNGSS